PITHVSSWQSRCRSLKKKLHFYRGLTLFRLSQQKINKLIMLNERFTAISFFCGCGGLDLGFLGGFKYKGRSITRRPFDILHAYDNEPKCIATYKENISDDAQVKDLSDFDPDEMAPADVLIGGFPCQEFSTAGRRKGLNSDRGKL